MVIIQASTTVLACGLLLSFCTPLAFLLRSVEHLLLMCCLRMVTMMLGSATSVAAPQPLHSKPSGYNGFSDQGL